ncbi:MAG: DegT/DnrJ/EryC1/StrS family aminotransferase [Ginsengibacter sp.]
MINVTKTFLPPFEEYTAILKRAWDKAWITNNGELVQELEMRLKEFLGTYNLLFTANGTVPLQMALKVLNITKEVITTPFSYVATTNVILWEGCKPVFVDIDSETLCIDADKIEEAITPHTQAILATHVYGIPCDVEKIKRIAEKHNLKVIYDGAHAFGCEYKGKSLLSYGDISTCSFHATKIFHTVEGGCIITNNDDTAKKLYLYRQFGHINDDYFSMGINGKNSEFHAAMGLAVLPQVHTIIGARKKISAQYDSGLPGFISMLTLSKELKHNYSYYPVFFESEEALLIVVERLREKGISGRRYFFPSLNTLSFVDYKSCPVSEEKSRRVLCLPLYFDLSKPQVQTIIDCITNAFATC